MNPTFSQFLSSKATEWQQELSQLNTRYNLISWSRAGAFLLGVGLVYWLMKIAPVGAIFAGAVALVAFLFLLKVHAEVAGKREHVRRKLNILEEEQKILNWDWLDRDAGDHWKNPEHNFSYDLDLFGRGSLFQYLHRHGTSLGGTRLADWMQSPSLDREEILQRQAAVQELTTKQDWQLQFQARGNETDKQQDHPESLLTWMQDPYLYRENPIVTRLLLFMPILFVLSLLGWIVTTIPGVNEALGGFFLPGWLPIAIFLANLGISGLHMGRISQQQNLFAKKSSLLKTYAGLLREIEQLDATSPWLTARKERIQRDGERASNSIERLGELLYRLDQRLNIAAALVLNGIWLWDIRYMKRLEEWKHQFRDHLPDWLEVIADLDAMNGIARMATGRADLIYPEIGTQDFHFKGTGLGHLLLNPDSRVDNDVAWNKSGEFLIVTGANMAGKSTFLRTVGTNLILGQMGAPVCAQTLSLVPIPMMTSIRATDSLTDHESYFYAELKRLKIVIDRLRKEAPVFIIVDEMLRGTNSRDKQEGSRRFIEQLIGMRGVGMIATHDLSLGTLADDYPDFARNKRFEVSIEGESLSFDYKLMDGISQNLNATFLMQQMGIMPKEG